MKKFLPKMQSIIGTFDRQIWTGPKEDRAESIGEVEFDATAQILGLTIEQLHQLQDCTESTDQIGQEIIKHSGPCSVFLEHGICQFFDVDNVKSITKTKLKAAQAWLNSLPPKVYVARLAFTTFVDVPVSVNHPSQVQQAALAASQKALNEQSHNVTVGEIRPVT
jgi:hypothetical protein